MSDELMPSFEVKLSREDFDRLPRHPAYKYELLEGMTYISPRAHYYHAQLRLHRFRVGAGDIAETTLRPASVSDLDVMVPLLQGAFSKMQPFGSLDKEHGLAAAEKSLRSVFAGGDGPLAEPASFVALQGEKIVGAILITLVPGGDAADSDSYYWNEAAPADLWTKRQGQPHLTWIFVQRNSQGRGVGTQLLQKAVRVLKKQGYRSLWTTFQQGNDSSALWHWRNGFELQPHLMSKRRMRRDFV